MHVKIKKETSNIQEIEIPWGPLQSQALRIGVKIGLAELLLVWKWWKIKGLWEYNADSPHVIWVQEVKKNLDEIFSKQGTAPWVTLPAQFTADSECGIVEDP